MGTIHPYFRLKARLFFHLAGGNPDNASQLAEWAQAARERPTDVPHSDPNGQPYGAIVAEDGTVVAETRAAHGMYGHTVLYVSRALVPQAESLVGVEQGMATATATTKMGQKCIYVPLGQVASGSGQALQTAARKAGIE